MFELQDAKRVRRSELRSKSSSPDPVKSYDDVKNQFRRQLDQLYQHGISEQQTNPVEPSEECQGAIDDINEEAYEFQLFSQKPEQSTISAPQPPKILLRSPSPENKEPGFVHPTRSPYYYFTGAESRDRRLQFQNVAVEGHDVQKESQAKWPGFELPWRVTTITLHSSKQTVAPSRITGALESGKRKRVGKKRRIILRTKLQALKERQEAARLAEVEKEALATEKRSRRNREKKLKRREKARSRKNGEEGAPVVGE
ncbi:MAG: hypothetical protein Q9186_007239 [Xanthomendoza sp. 1 TL-2023]